MIENERDRKPYLLRWGQYEDEKPNFVRVSAHVCRLFEPSDGHMPFLQCRQRTSARANHYCDPVNEVVEMHEEVHDEVHDEVQDVGAWRDVRCAQYAASATRREERDRRTRF